MNTLTRKTHNPATFKDYHLHEHDACGIVAIIEKQQIPTNQNIKRCLDALTKLNHRAGFVNNEGDGVGIHLDLPIALWKEKLQQQNLSPELVEHPSFAVGHLFIDKKRYPILKDFIFETLAQKGLNVLFHTTTSVDSTILGPLASTHEPVFLQVALLPTNSLSQEKIEKVLFDTVISLEKNEYIHVASLSTHHVVYKLMGSSETLYDYYLDLQNPLAASSMTLGHNRYSTNTLSNFFRVQPFSVLGHNGEINTIAKLRQEAELIGVPLTVGGSDSQDLNRTIETLLVEHQYSLFEALDLIFPPIIYEIKQYPKHLQDLYTYMREAWGHFAQGPAGIISRYQNEAVFSVDSLGLRPLWNVEIDTSYIFASEPGVISLTEMIAEPKSFAPGEKLGLKFDSNGQLVVYDHFSFQEEVYKRFSQKVNLTKSRQRLASTYFTAEAIEQPIEPVSSGVLAAFGWDREHVQQLEAMADKGVEPIRSLGHDVPLAALDSERRNLADYIKESVAVVTNPAIDRDREIEHFSTRVVIGRRPPISSYEDHIHLLQLRAPILLEGSIGKDSLNLLSQPSYEQVIGHFNEWGGIHHLHGYMHSYEKTDQALQRLCTEAINMVRRGATLLILDDRHSHKQDKLWIDPHLFVSAIDGALRENQIRRKCSILLRSGAIRSLHDIMVAIGLGADLINPYLLFQVVYTENAQPCMNLIGALYKGMEKVISTLGIHELRGYSRLFSAIGLHDDVANILKIPNFFGGRQLQHNLDALRLDALKRADDYSNHTATPTKSFHLFPKIWKGIGDVAKTGLYDNYRLKLDELEQKYPVSIRHLLSIREANQPSNSQQVSLDVGEHSLPFIISSMSFGSQNEIAFRAYAEAANRLNMISLNGEGGEIKDMIGKYPHTRGQQIASGRFGVNAALLNSSNLLEIKIGQGAKPGEGGHLPGSKVTAKIAEARNATIGSDLISPSNNHDIYSIEDLAQMITELKTANDKAKVAVKVPVVPNIGTIAVGVAKAGADFINISGFDGGTGAARIHALQHVGLPVEIGVKAAHNALLEAGLRHKIEIWADGGVRSAKDVFKLMLLGANRIGFGTLSMIAIGCTTCRGCHLDTCHVGIATQIESVEQAKEHGLKRFVPRQSEAAIQGLQNLFQAFADELKQLTASVGFTSLQEVVGRSDLLQQLQGERLVNLQFLLEESRYTPLIKEEHSFFDTKWNEEFELEPALLLHTRNYKSVSSTQRVLGSRTAGHQAKQMIFKQQEAKPIDIHFRSGSIPGNGLAAYNTHQVNIYVEGGAQDGVGKTSFGGNTYILKGVGKSGISLNGSVGKGFGYGAQSGLLIAQGNADSRAGIRLSGADMIIGGHLLRPIPEKEYGNMATFANIKGFAFEYMTNGRALVLGDPGPWMCAGMTGGVVYVRHQPEKGMTKEALMRRLAKGAKVVVTPLSETGIDHVTELIKKYQAVLFEYNQEQEGELLSILLQDVSANFLQIIPEKEHDDQTISTE